MGERAAPDPLFLPGPLISGGASFRPHSGPLDHPLPSSPQSLKGPEHTEVSGVRIPFTSSESRPMQHQCGLWGPEASFQEVEGTSQVEFPAFWALDCPLSEEAKEGQPKPRGGLSFTRDAKSSKTLRRFGGI